MRRVLVTGSRDWTDRGPIYRALYYQRIAAGNGEMIVVHGAAAGADAIADEWAHKFYPDHVVAEPHPADWSMGKIAGSVRNQLMANLGADVCLAFPLLQSRGTWDCVRRARAAGIEVIEHYDHLPRHAAEATT